MVLSSTLWFAHPSCHDRPVRDGRRSCDGAAKRLLQRNAAVDCCNAPMVGLHSLSRLLLREARIGHTSPTVQQRACTKQRFIEPHLPSPLTHTTGMDRNI